MMRAMPKRAAKPPSVLDALTRATQASSELERLGLTAADAPGDNGPPSMATLPLPASSEEDIDEEDE